MNIKHILSAALFGWLVLNTWSCRKEEALNVDMSKYIVDIPARTEIDDWIKTNLTNPYNIQLVYRYERNLTDVAKDVSPIKMEKVKPTAEAILNIFLKTYEKVAGPAFIKQYTPKQFVLYGSPAYNTNGSITLGTADGGRRVVLYELNDLNFEDPAQVSRKMRTIHHEFTHILNQIIAIPPEFEQVTKGEYEADWTGSANTEAVAKSLGFVSRYARSVYTEDFAEVTAHLLIEGQLWYDSYAKSAGAAAQTKLKRKEALVVDYFKQFFNINFRELQYEVAKVLREVYKDNSKSFSFALKNGLIANPMVVNFGDSTHYKEFGKSAKFDLVWESVKTGLGVNGRKPVSFNLVFVSPTVVQLQHDYLSAAGAALVAWYDFNLTIDNNGDIRFQRFDAGTNVTQYNNGRNAQVLAGYTPLLDYLNNNVFNGDWIPKESGPLNYLKFGGFYLKSDPDNYFYGKF